MNKEAEKVAKLILIAVILILFCIVFGLMAYLVKNKSVVNSQPQISASPEPTATPEINNETVDWQTYTNVEVNFTFKYPSDWEIVADYFYETAVGIKAIVPTIILQKIGNKGSDNVISINQRQFLCDQGSCEIVAGNEIETYSRNQDILNIFDNIVKSFEKKEETINWKTYRNENWTIKLPLAYERSTSDKEAETDVFMEKSFHGINIIDLSTETLAFSKLAFLKIQTKPSDISLFKYVQSLAKKSNKYDDYFQKYIQSIKDPENIYIGDKSIIQTELVIFEGCPQFVYWFEKSPTEYIQIDTTKCFEIGAPFGVNGLTDNQRLAMKKEVEQILSTFKFIEK